MRWSRAAQQPGGQGLARYAAADREACLVAELEVSAVVAGLASVSASRMAVVGRQCRYLNLVATVATVVSARAVVSRAASRACSPSGRRRWAATVSAIRSHSPGG